VRRERADAQLREKRLRTDADPEPDLTARDAVLQVVYDQDRLRGAVDEQPRADPADLDSQVSPDTRLEVHVRFVNARGLLAQAVEFESGLVEWLRRS